MTVDVPCPSGLQRVRAETAIELGERGTLSRRQRRVARRAHRPRSRRRDAIPRFRGSDEVQRPARNAAGERQDDRRNQGERQENEKEATTKPNSLHWHLLRVGHSTVSWGNLQTVTKPIHPR